MKKIKFLSIIFLMVFLPTKTISQITISPLTDATICEGESILINAEATGEGCINTPLNGCQNCNSSIAGLNFVDNLYNGQRACLPLGESFTGSIRINGGTLEICGNANIQFLELNGGQLIVNGSLTTNSFIANGTLINNGQITVNGNFTSYQQTTNNGHLTVTGTSVFHGSTLFLGTGSNLSTNNLTISSRIEGPTDACSKVSINQNTIIYGFVNGKVDLCDANGIESLFGFLSPDVTTDCSCNVQEACNLTYLWSPSTGLDNPNSPRPIASPTSTTSYTVTVTDNNGNSSSESLTITVNPIEVSAGNDAQICPGKTTQLNGFISCLPVGGGECQTPTTTPSQSCSPNDIQIDGSNFVNINSGDRACIAANSNFNGGISINGGTLIIEGNTNPYMILLNGGTIINAGSISGNSSLYQSNGIFENFGQATFSQYQISSGSLINNGTIESNSISKSNSNIQNFNLINVKNDFNNYSGNIANNNTINVGGALRNFSSITNNCTVKINNNFTNYKELTNTGNFAAANFEDLNGVNTLSFRWTPATGLSDPTILNPIATPIATTTYTLQILDGTTPILSDAVTVTIKTIGCNNDLCSGLDFAEVERENSGVANNRIYGFDMDPIGDLDGDGINDLVVTGVQLGAFDWGEIWFMNSNGTVRTKKLLEYPAIMNSPVVLGRPDFVSVSFLGDLDGIGPASAAIAFGHPGDDDGISTTGSSINLQSDRDRGAVVIVFIDASGNILSTQKISNTQGGLPANVLSSSIVDVNEIQTSFGSTDSDNFGTSITNLGDLDGPGGAATFIAVGTPGEDVVLPPPPFFRDPSSTLRSNDGAVWILGLDQNGLVIQSSQINGLNPIMNGLINVRDRFGSHVESMGDLDGPGNSAVQYLMVSRAHFGGETDAFILGLNANGNVISAVTFDKENPLFNGLLDFTVLRASNFGDLNDITSGVGTMALTDGEEIFITQFGPNANIEDVFIISPNQNVNFSTLPSGFGTSSAFLGDLTGNGTAMIAVGSASASLDEIYVISTCLDFNSIVSLSSGSNSVQRQTEINSSKTGIFVYPTIVDNEIKINGINGETNIRIISASGEVILQKTIYEDTSLLLNELAHGIYLVNITSETELITQKIFKN